MGLDARTRAGGRTDPPQRGFASGTHEPAEAGRRARRLTVNMDTLVAFGTLSAWGYSVVLLATGRHEHYFESAAPVVAFLVLGR